jgi:hypothetical protein
VTAAVSPSTLPQFLDGPVRGEQRRRALVAPHDDLQQVLGRRGRELAHTEVVDDEQRDGREVGERGLAGAGELSVGEFVDEGVGFAVEDAMALLDDGHTDGLSEMALPRAGRAEEEPVVVLGDEAAGGEFEDEAAVELLVEVEIEGVERLADVAEAGLLEAALITPQNPTEPSDSMRPRLFSPCPMTSSIATGSAWVATRTPITTSSSG